MYEHDEPPDGAAVKTTAGAVVEADLESQAEVTRENPKPNPDRFRRGQQSRREQHCHWAEM